MKKSLYISALALMLAGTMFTGCSEFLDGSEQNRSNIDESNLTPTQRRNQAFSELREIFNGKSSGLMNLYVMGTDIYVNQSNEATGTEFYSYSLTPSQDDVKSLYKQFYGVLDNANAAITNDNGAVDCDARFIRGLCYYNLTQQFGAVPFVTSPVTTADRYFPRESVEKIYKYVIDDLKGVYEKGNIPATSHDGHCSKASVAALIAKLALAAGWDTEVTPVNYAEKGEYTYSYGGDENDYFVVARDYATKAINDAGGESALVDTYENKWSPNNEGNTEELFSIQYDRGTASNVLTEGNGWAGLFCGYYGNENAGYKWGSHLNNPNKKMLSLYTIGDQRFDATFMTTIYSYDTSIANWYEAGYYAYYNDNANKTQLAIKYRFLPPYATYDDMKTDFENHRSQYQKGEARIVRVGDKVTYYNCNSSMTDFPAEGNLGTDDYYTDEPTYSGYLKTLNGSLTGMMCKKWDDPQAQQTRQEMQNFRDVVILSLSDIILVRAEAKMMLGESYLSDINLIRKRSGAEEIQSLTDYNPSYSHSFTLRDIDIILDERALELFGEPTRWEDLRRTKQLALYYNEFSNYSLDSKLGTGANIKWYRPIPNYEISNNTGISSEDQNPGY